MDRQLGSARHAIRLGRRPAAAGLGVPSAADSVRSCDVLAATHDVEFARGSRPLDGSTAAAAVYGDDNGAGLRGDVLQRAIRPEYLLALFDVTRHLAAVVDHQAAESRSYIDPK